MVTFCQSFPNGVSPNWDGPTFRKSQTHGNGVSWWLCEDIFATFPCNKQISNATKLLLICLHLIHCPQAWMKVISEILKRAYVAVKWSTPIWTTPIWTEPDWTWTTPNWTTPIWTTPNSLTIYPGSINNRTRTLVRTSVVKPKTLHRFGPFPQTTNHPLI